MPIRYCIIVSRRGRGIAYASVLYCHAWQRNAQILQSRYSIHTAPPLRLARNMFPLAEWVWEWCAYLVSPTENAAKSSIRGHYGSSLEIVSAVSMHTFWLGQPFRV